MPHLTHMFSASLIHKSTGRLFTRSRKDFVLKEIRKLHVCSRSSILSWDRDEHSPVGMKKCIHGASVLTSRKTLAYSDPLQISKRDWSAETYSKYFSPDVAPIGYAQKILEGVHSATGLPWWASIALTTVALRSIVTLPLSVYSAHVLARVELLQPEIGKLSQELRREVAFAVKKYGWSAKHARFKYNSTMKKLIKDLYIRDNCHPAKASLVLWFQIPMWVCMSFALRNMSGAAPTASKDIEAPVLCPDLKTEGGLWFPDLTAPDTTLILPVLLGVTNLLNIEIHSMTAEKMTKFRKGLLIFMRLLSLILVPISAMMPSCMCHYWVCSSLYGLGQNVLLKIPSVRRLLRLPRTPSESQTPFRDIYNAAKRKYILRFKRKDS